MRTIIWKELRENAMWGALVLVATVIGTLLLLNDALERRPFYLDFLVQEFLIVMLIAPSLLALILGFAQTIPDLGRDRWAFQIQRGVSMTRIFLAKTIAAGILHMILVGAAMTVATLWVSRGGIQRYPFEWRMLVPAFVCGIASFGFYFAAMQVVLREAGFFITRLLPLAIPCFVVFGSVSVSVEFDEHVPLFAWIGVILFTLMLAVSACGVFVSHGEVQRMARVSRVCIAIPNFAVFLTALCFGLVGSCMLAGEFYETVTRRDVQRVFDEEHVREYHQVIPNGHVVRFTHKSTPLDSVYRWKTELVDIVDLDDPDSKAFESQLIPRTPDARTALSQLPHLHSILVSRGGLLVSALEIDNDRKRLVTEIPGNDPRMGWWYSSTRGVFLGYTWPVKTKDVSEPARLDTVIGPGGFATSSSWPTQRFGKLLGVAGGWRGLSRFSAWRSNIRRRIRSDSNFIAFDTGLYELNFAKRSVIKRYSPPAGSRILSMGSLGESFIIMLDNDEIHIHTGVLEKIGIIQQEQHYQTRNENEDIEPAIVYLGLPGKFEMSITIPAELQPYDIFLFGIVSETGEMVFHNATNLGNVDRQRIVSLDANGRVAHVRDLPSESPQLGDYFILSGLATITPAGPILVAGILDAAIQEMNGQSPGLLGRQILRDPTRSLLVLSIMLASAFWSALAARHGAASQAVGVWCG